MIMKWAVPSTVASASPDRPSSSLALPHRCMAGATAFDEQRQLEAGEQSGRRLKAVGARPGKHIYRRCLDRLAAQSGGQATKVRRRPKKNLSCWRSHRPLPAAKAAKSASVRCRVRARTRARRPRTAAARGEPPGSTAGERHRPPERDGERHQTAEGMSDQLRRRARRMTPRGLRPQAPSRRRRRSAVPPCHHSPEEGWRRSEIGPGTTR